MTTGYPIAGGAFNNSFGLTQGRLGSDQPTTMPIAGSYFDTLKGFLLSPTPSGASAEDAFLYKMLGAQALGAGETARQNKESMRELLQYQREAAREANEMGIRNQVIGSFLKDVPAAIGGAVARRTEYLPAQVEIQRAAMLNRSPAMGIPNYYSFVG